jgi:hypothetical protein
MWRSRF